MLERLEERLVLSAIVVTGTGDAIAADGFVTLREAITSINNGANVDADVTAVGTYGVNDTISFNIVGAGVQTIAPATALPTMVKPVVIDGYSQPLASTNTLTNSDNAVLLIELNGTNAGVGANGLVLGAGSAGSSVSGLVINRFAGTQILVQSNGNAITGNFVGTTATGNASLSVTGGFGIGIDGASSNTIGGTTPTARNVIGGNSDGINLNTGSQSNVIQGNFIGIGADATTPVSNRFHGVALQGNGGLGVQNNQIGGTVAGAGNTITNNGAAGVAVFGDANVNPQNSGNAILGNSIFNNGLLSPATRLGIDLVGTGSYPADDGVTANDSVDGDGDNGPNLLQNYPILTSTTSDSVSTTIVGTLNSRADTNYRIEFFSSSTTSGTGHGEGQTFLGFTNVTTNAAGNVHFNTTLTTPVSNGQFLSATATSVETTSTPAPTSPVGVLGTASTFAILAGGAVSATLTNVTGDIGLSPAAAVTATGNNSGTIHNGDAVAAQAQTDLTAAYNFLGAQPITMQMAGDLGGLTLTPGVYHFTAAATLTGTLKLDTQGDPDAFFVFQFDAAFAAAAASSVVFLNGATDSLYWKGAAAFGLGADAHFVGNIVGNVAITMGAGATLADGRALSRGGAVTTSGGSVDLTSTVPPNPSTPNNTSEFSAVRVNLNLTSPRPTLSISDFAMLEGNAGTTNAVFTVTLSAVSGQTVTVVATSADGTANFPSDYVTLVPTTLTFLPGETSKTVTVAVNGDIVPETNETLFVNLTGAINATIADGQGMNTIINDDPVPPSSPTLSVSDFAVLEGNAGTTSAVFTVTLSAVSAQTVTVVAASANGTATTPSDYLALLPTTLTFLPGEISKTVTVTVNGDVVSEANETLFVNLTGATNATIADGQGLLTIINDDPVPPSSPTLSISDFAVLEGNSGTTNAVFTVTLSSVSAQAVTVVATSTNGTATTPSDYLALLPTTLTFLPGEISKTITVTVNGDVLPEGNETLFVNLTGATNATIADGQGLLTIINDDPVPPSAPTLSISDFAMLEGNAGTTNAVFTVTLTSVTAQTVTVVATSANGTGNSASDYVALAPTTLTFLPGEFSKTVTVAVNGDLLSEADETFFVNLTGAVNATISDGQGLNTIINDDPVPPSSPTLSINDFAVLEGNAGTTNAVFTVTLSAVSAQAVTVVATSANGTATTPSDYVALAPTTLTFLPGETTKTVTVSVNGDLVNEPNETLFVNLTGSVNATIADGQGLMTVINDDPVPPVTSTLSISDVTISEGNTGTTNAVFTVTLSAISAQTVTVLATSADGTANSPSDYLALLPTPLTFLPGETSKTVTVAINGDTVDEVNETFFVNLTGATNATIADDQGLGTIVNDDSVLPPSATLSISDFAVLEGNAGTTSAVFTVTLSAVSEQTVTVLATSANGTATTPSDYLALVPTTVTFLPGETTQTVTVAVNGDTSNEGNETLFVNLTGATNATIADGQGLLTIINDDPLPPANPTLSISDFAVLEGNAGTTSAVFTVTLSAVSAQTVTILATSADGTATTPSDYLALVPTTLTFLPGETTKTVTVIVNGDTTNESNETLFVNLTGATNATIADAQGLLTIINDDPLPPANPTLSISDFAVLEGNAGTSTAVFTVTLSAVSGQTVTVVATSADGSASSSSDYLALAPTTITFLPGETSKTVTVVVNGDTVNEGNETLFVNLTGATNATIADGQGLLTIINDD
ncbi:MAG: hypothetical protein JWN70_6291, partial [Planctomycetaceae bacterium]|nr:hypothetical protein [Planctomycetaceae bacterium]